MPRPNLGSRLSLSFPSVKHVKADRIVPIRKGQNLLVSYNARKMGLTQLFDKESHSNTRIAKHEKGPRPKRVRVVLGPKHTWVTKRDADKAIPG
jgi:hypothetical protein